MKYFLLLCISSLLAAGCSPNPKTEKNKSAVKAESKMMEISQAWVRPGTKGGNSAAYLHIFNGTNDTDTLVAIHAEVTDKAQIHESFEENGMAGMRPAGRLALAPDSSLKLQPGGLHIMLMNLKKDLSEGDSITITLKFANTESRELMVPIKISN